MVPQWHDALFGTYHCLPRCMQIAPACYMCTTGCGAARNSPFCAVRSVLQISTYASLSATG